MKKLWFSLLFFILAFVVVVERVGGQGVAMGNAGAVQSNQNGSLYGDDNYKYAYSFAGSIPSVTLLGQHIFGAITGPATPATNRGTLYLNSVTGHISFKHSNGTVVDIEGAAATGLAGADTQVQYNDGGVMGADSGLTYTKASSNLAVTGDVASATLHVSGASTVHATTLSTGNLTVSTGNETISAGNLVVTLGTVRIAAVATGTPATFACFDATGVLVKSATACQ